MNDTVDHLFEVLCVRKSWPITVFFSLELCLRASLYFPSYTHSLGTILRHNGRLAFFYSDFAHGKELQCLRKK